MLGKKDILDHLTKASKKKPATYTNYTEANRAIENTFAAIRAISTSNKYERLTLTGFGTFKKVKRAARTGTNPATGAPIKIKASKTISFKVSKSFKESLK